MCNYSYVNVIAITVKNAVAMKKKKIKNKGTKNSDLLAERLEDTRVSIDFQLMLFRLRYHLDKED